MGRFNISFPLDDLMTQGAEFVGAGYGEGAVAYCEAYSFCGTGADVSGGEDSGE